ncbi:hypothetical protein GF337_02865 [candidate division KSB1 bacterium]|nr:hypothetical protein [candidate division KSB1 bacterium]
MKNMGRYACRYPGHCDYWQTMAKCGFLNDKPLRFGSTSISPIEFTTVLFDSQEQFHYNKSDMDIAMVRIDMVGYAKNKKKRIIYQLFDERDSVTGFTAMQRTVGFMMGVGARLILDGKISKSGVISPIDISFKIIKNELEHYGMKISRQEISLS